MTSVAHLARRFIGSLSSAEPDSASVSWARAHLLEHEWQMWSAMDVRDRRHSLTVARRFTDNTGHPPRAAVAGALLHDVGKTEARLSTLLRVVATVVGPRGARFRAYHDHERLGAERLERSGSDRVTVSLVRGEGEWADALRRADDV